ncbi:MAG: MerR family transcriptional regulator [Alphaproteobacteria bacterium]|nr:MerR family transcriptional regulator [Alphaproteobacteria bacterium]MDA7983064.1 MerR family transcriptional regulator [Alphaproteobacteria bacterium]MDA7987261.1 MerR family transcriptional regulator [Alphaproteobacteria bacterium]MDA8001427.1 MerR family transcriptional regulator [Alphaproteobacteria bacterium]MDA8006346.1 MerR family transcriptional regulator [Alphaproteobacteria bacterium]
MTEDGRLLNIREAAEALGEPMHTLRHWESKFSELRPLRQDGGRRLYRSSDMEVLRRIQALVRRDGLTSAGVRRILGGDEGDWAGERLGVVARELREMAGDIERVLGRRV